MSNEISHGSLSTYPEDTFLAKQQLQRDPMNQELAKRLAERLGIKSEDLNTSESETYNEYSRSPSFRSGHDYYKTYDSSRSHKGNVFDNPKRYEEGGKKHQKKYKKRTHTKKYKKSKTRRRKSMKKYV